MPSRRLDGINMTKQREIFAGCAYSLPGSSRFLLMVVICKLNPARVMAMVLVSCIGDVQRSEGECTVDYKDTICASK